MEVMLYLNAFICAAIAFRLLAFRRGSHNHYPRVSLEAWLVIVASGTVTIRTLTGYYQSIDPAELLLNIVICLAIWTTHGNMSGLFGTDRSRHDR